jgi:hypothetical protein
LAATRSAAPTTCAAAAARDPWAACTRFGRLVLT